MFSTILSWIVTSYPQHHTRGRSSTPWWLTRWLPQSIRPLLDRLGHNGSLHFREKTGDKDAINNHLWSVWFDTVSHYTPKSYPYEQKRQNPHFLANSAIIKTDEQVCFRSPGFMGKLSSDMEGRTWHLRLKAWVIFSRPLVKCLMDGPGLPSHWRNTEGTERRAKQWYNALCKTLGREFLRFIGPPAWRSKLLEHISK